jgi:hypothetical protein
VKFLSLEAMELRNLVDSRFGRGLLFFFSHFIISLKRYDMVIATTFLYYCGQKKWDINVIVVTFNVK